jgi:CRP-like cAMP-binding protein
LCCSELRSQSKIVSLCHYPLNVGTTAMVSLIHTLTDGVTAEMGVVGREGVVGVALFMGGGSTVSEALVQIAGQGFRLPAVYVGGEFQRGGGFQQILLRYAQALLTQISQTVVCNVRHTITQRMCRWLLLTLDRVPGDEVRMTHEFLAQMLAVRRPSVTEVARRLQTAGIIRCGRGYITIVNRRGVEGHWFRLLQINPGSAFKQLLGSRISLGGRSAPPTLLTPLQALDGS